MKKYFWIILPFVFVYIWYFSFYKNQHPAVIPVTSAVSNLSLYVEPDDGRQPILDALKAAQKEVLVEVYLLSDKEIIQGLEDAKVRGVAVNVMLEQHPYGGGKINDKSKQELAGKGISVSWTNSSFALTHEKAIIIDSDKVFILSQNLTTSAFDKNREYDVLDTNASDVGEVRDIFMDDWKRENFTPAQTEIVESPDNSRAGLTSLINSAAKSIDIEMEEINDKDIVSLLDSRVKSLQVRIILPDVSQISASEMAIKDLKSNGISIRTLKSPYIHAKLILVDDAKAYTGSINLSTQSMDANRELGIIMSQADIINRLSKTFDGDWSAANP